MASWPTQPSVEELLAERNQIRRQAPDPIAGGNGNGPARPLFGRDWILYGDSKLAYNYSTFSTGGILQNQFGPGHWAAGYSMGKIRTPVEYMFSLAGRTTAEMLTVLPDVLACPAKGVFLLGSSNDRRNSSFDIEDSKRNLLTICNALVLAGKYIVVFSETPKGEGAFDHPAGQAPIHYAMHQWLQNDLPKLFPGRVVAADAFTEMLDPASPLYRPLPGLMQDGAHQNIMGGEIMGRKGWEAAQKLGDFLDPIEFDANLYSQYSNLTGSVTPGSPYLTGTAGQKFATANATADSVVATGWRAYGQGLAGFTTKWTLEPDEEEEGVFWQCVRITGTGTDTANLPIVNFGADLPMATLNTIAANTAMIGRCKTITEGKGCMGLSLGTSLSKTVAQADGTNKAVYFGIADGDFKNSIYEYPSKRILRSFETPVYKKDATLGGATLTISIGLKQLGTVDFTVKIAKIGYGPDMKG